MVLHAGQEVQCSKLEHAEINFDSKVPVNPYWSCSLKHTKKEDSMFLIISPAFRAIYHQPIDRIYTRMI